MIYGVWLGAIGFWFVIEGIASTPQANRGTSKVGAYLLMGIGFISFAFGAVSIVGGFDVLTGSPEIRMVTTILFGGASILFFVTIVPEIFSRESFVKSLARNFG